jgi:hypothetical protein
MAMVITADNSAAESMSLANSSSQDTARHVSMRCSHRLPRKINDGRLEHARMCVSPTREQVLDEIELEIVDAMRLSEAADFPVLMRALWAVRTELLKLRQRPDS